MVVWYEKQREEQSKSQNVNARMVMQLENVDFHANLFIF